LCFFDAVVLRGSFLLRDRQDKRTRAATHAPSIIVSIVAAVVVALSVYYLLRPQPLLVQGEADATRLDIAARVDGRVKEIPFQRDQNVRAGAVLVRIDNPETLAKADWLAFILVLVFCGLRASEVRALSWGDVDFTNDTITVIRRADRWGRIGQPKSKAGTRTIPFPKVVTTL
jgi:integrase